jgi:flavin-dependent dehydrogenase
MAKTNSQPQPPPDALVLGEHPAAYLTAALLRHKTKLRVLHSTIPGEPENDRLVIINPNFFSLHPLLEALRRKLDMVAIYGLQFLSGDPEVRSEYRSKGALAFVASYRQVRVELMKVAGGQGVELHTPKGEEQLQIHRLDESGIDVTLGKAPVRPKVLVLAGALPEKQRRLLGLPESWEAEVVHRYTYLKLSGTKWTDLGARPVMPMSLNLREMLCWGWLLPGPKAVQLAVEQPVETLSRVLPRELLANWVEILQRNEVLSGKPEVPLALAESIDLPLAGALAHEGVANRTLLVGPAGGFYSACTEDIYPNCWSALYAADAIKKAIKEVHLQDALQPYRHKWRTTLGDYLRGPQQNLRFLLPLVYRNQNMTTRLTESILLGKSVVR